MFSFTNKKVIGVGMHCSKSMETSEVIQKGFIFTIFFIKFTSENIRYTLSQIANRPLASSKVNSVNQKETTIIPISWRFSMYY